MAFLASWLRKSASQALNILCYEEDGLQVAHCLEMDLVATGATRPEAVGDLADVIRAHVLYAFEHDNIEHIFKPAPAEYWAKFAQSESVGVVDLDLRRELRVTPNHSATVRRFSRVELRESAACV